MSGGGGYDYELDSLGQAGDNAIRSLPQYIASSVIDLYAESHVHAARRGRLCWIAVAFAGRRIWSRVLLQCTYAQL